MSTLLSLSNDLAAAVARVAPAIVSVNARRRLPSTGIHWRPGIVVTAHHTVRVDDDITVSRPDGRAVRATLAGRDASTDLAVLTVQDAELPVVEVADSTALSIGHIVLAVGYGPRASLGVVSALGGRWRTWRGGDIDQLVCADLVLYPGFSGGPLVDAQGRVVGMNTSGLSRQVPLAIPTSVVTRVTDELVKSGRIARGYIGVGLQPVRLPETMTRALGLTGTAGLVVVNLEPDGPAARAGLLIGDILIALDGKPVGETDDVQAALGPLRAGARVTISLVRGGARTDVELTVGERPQPRR
jgi:S1-C subfamily serine protease